MGRYDMVAKGKNSVRTYQGFRFPMTQGTAEMPHGMAVIIPAAGAGSRMETRPNKILLPLGGQPMICHTAAIFQAHPAVAQICVVAQPEDFEALERCFADHSAWSKLLPWVEGGAERQDSVFRGLAALREAPPEKVLVHDGARPFCSVDLVGRVVAALKTNGCVVPTLPIYDTVRRITSQKGEVVDRDTLLRCQTPQGFHWKVLEAAHGNAEKTELMGTDDAHLAGAMGERIFLSPVRKEI